VVARIARAKATREQRSPLSPERIVDQALVLIERDGLEGWSLRTLAGELRCEAMSLYHHFPSKGHILDAIADRLVGQLSIERRPREAWNARFRRLSLDYYDLARRFPRAFPLLATRRANGPNLYRMVETVLSLLVEGGFTPREAAQIFRTFGAFLNGAGLTQIAVSLRQPDATPVAIESTVDEEHYPTLATAAAFLGPAHLQENFQVGFERLLSWVESEASAKRKSRRSAKR